MDGLQRALEQLGETSRLCSRTEVLADRFLLPAEPGLYAWYFDVAPAGVPTASCLEREGRRLLYVGISPARAKSGRNLRRRIRQHYAGNARSSTLRRTLGCLLGDELGLVPIRTAPGNWRFSKESEDTLSAWMEKHAWVTWAIRERPWDVERGLIEALDLPLNLQGNSSHPFASTLRAARARMRERTQGPV